MNHKHCKAEHRKRMKDRREHQLAREPGFTPVHNSRVSTAIQRATLAYQLQGLDAVRAQEEAIKFVAKQLPKPTPSKLYSPRPSKSDSAVYRKAVSPDQMIGE